jgi:hypothetical protein
MPASFLPAPAARKGRSSNCSYACIAALKRFVLRMGPGGAAEAAPFQSCALFQAAATFQSRALFQAAATFKLPRFKERRGSPALSRRNGSIRSDFESVVTAVGLYGDGAGSHWAGRQSVLTAAFPAEIRIVPAKRISKLWDCKVTPAGSVCQGRNTTGCISNNDAADAGVGEGISTRGIHGAFINGGGGSVSEAVTQLVPSAKADSVWSIPGPPALPSRAFPCRRFAAEEDLVASRPGREFRNRLRKSRSYTVGCGRNSRSLHCASPSLQEGLAPVGTTGYVGITGCVGMTGRESGMNGTGMTGACSQSDCMPGSW